MDRIYISSSSYDRRKNEVEEDLRLPLYLPVPPLPAPPRNSNGYEKGEGLEIVINPDEDKVDGVIVIDL